MKGHTMEDFENATPEALDAWETYLDDPFDPVEDIEKFAYLRGWKHAIRSIESRNK